MSTSQEITRLLVEQHKTLAAKYRWKAENIVRFFDHLGMTTDQKVQFLAEELSRVHIAGRDERS